MESTDRRTPAIPPPARPATTAGSQATDPSHVPRILIIPDAAATFTLNFRTSCGSYPKSNLLDALFVLCFEQDSAPEELIQSVRTSPGTIPANDATCAARR